jgi:hypothetical protein
MNMNLYNSTDMNTISKRHILFLMGCIPARLAITALAYFYPKVLPILGVLAILPTIGFTLIFMMGWRKTGAEVFQGKIWWNSLRPLHALLWGSFAALALQRNPQAWKVLLLDTIIGLCAFLLYHHG